MSLAYRSVDLYSSHYFSSKFEEIFFDIPALGD